MVSLSLDCWHIIRDWLCQDGIEHLSSLRATSRQSRNLCDPIFLRDLTFEPDRRPDHFAHYAGRILDIEDDLRCHVRNVAITSMSNIPPDAEMIDLVERIFMKLDLHDLGLEPRLRSLSWSCAGHVPVSVLNILEKYLPATKFRLDLRQDYRSQSARTPSADQLHYVKYINRLMASPNLHSLSTFAKSRSTIDPEDDPTLPSMEMIKQLVGRAPGLRELEMSLVRHRQSPHFPVPEGERLPTLESLSLDLSQVLHGLSCEDSLTSWAQHMDWTHLRALKLESISQSQCEAICTAFESRIPALRELSVVIVGSIGPVGQTLVESLRTFISKLDNLENISLIADMPNNHHLESIIQRPKLRRLTHRYPPSFLVFRGHFLSLGRLAQLRGIDLDFLSIDFDMHKCNYWKRQELDLIASLDSIVELELTAHLRGEQFELLLPEEISKRLQEAFIHINKNRVDRKLRSLTGTFRFYPSIMEQGLERRAWEIRANCSLATYDGSFDNVKTRILTNQRVQDDICKMVSNIQGNISSQRKATHTHCGTESTPVQIPSAKRRRSRPFIPSQVRSSEASSPLLDSVVPTNLDD